MKYTMLFAVTPDFQKVLLLRKPNDHKNILFRGRWTAPGGHVEPGETEMESVLREFKEETEINLGPHSDQNYYNYSDLVFVLRFACNCDPTEEEHEVAVYAILVTEGYLRTARGTPTEPLRLAAVDWVFPITGALWCVESLLSLSIARLKQPRPLQSANAPEPNPRTAAEESANIRELYT